MNVAAFMASLALCAGELLVADDYLIEMLGYVAFGPRQLVFN